MRIVVVGPGALGTLFASLLTLHSGHEIWLVDHNQERASYLSERGLCLVTGQNSQPLFVNITSNVTVIGHVDLVFLCVKSADVLKGLALVLPLVTEDNLLVAMQNGIGHHEVLRHYRGCWAVGVTAQGAALEAPGVVRHGGQGPTFMGFLEGTRTNWGLLREFTSILNVSGLEAEVSESIITKVWRKLLVNVGINALSVILDCPNGRILEIQEGRARLARAVREAELVACAMGVDVGKDPVSMTEHICVATAANISSMLQDVRKGKPTEIMAINGAVVKEGKRLDIPVPENEKLVQDVLALQSTSTTVLA